MTFYHFTLSLTIKNWHFPILLYDSNFPISRKDSFYLKRGFHSPLSFELFYLFLSSCQFTFSYVKSQVCEYVDQYRCNWSNCSRYKKFSASAFPCIIERLIPPVKNPLESLLFFLIIVVTVGEKSVNLSMKWKKCTLFPFPYRHFLLIALTNIDTKA